jgi:transposase
MFLTDEQWLQLTPLLLGNQHDGGGSAKNNRLFIEAMLWHVNNRRRWSDLPIEYGNWSTCYVRFRRWNESGVWKDMVTALSSHSELASEIQKIVEYGALLDMRTMARNRRKENRENRKIEKSKNFGFFARSI